jgi:hypothetical protein
MKLNASHLSSVMASLTLSYLIKEKWIFKLCLKDIMSVYFRTLPQVVHRLHLSRLQRELAHLGRGARRGRSVDLNLHHLALDDLRLLLHPGSLKTQCWRDMSGFSPRNRGSIYSRIATRSESRRVGRWHRLNGQL